MTNNPVLSLSGSRLLTSSGVGRRDPETSYSPDLREPELQAKTKHSRIERSMWSSRSGAKAWLELLDVPDSIVEAALNVDYEISRTYEAPQALVDLGVPSLLTEGAREWERSHGREIAAALAAVATRIAAVAPDLYGQCRDRFNSALDNGDDCSPWLIAAAGVRSYLPVRLVGRGPGPTRGPLTGQSHLWKLARPDVWHQDGRLTLNGENMRTNRKEWGVDIYTPEQVHTHLQHLTTLGYR